MTESKDHFGAKTKLPGTDMFYYRLDALADKGNIERLPFSIKVLLEALLRNCDGYIVTPEDVEKLAGYHAPNCLLNRGASFCKTSPAYRPLSIWPRCGRRWRGSAAIPRRSIRKSLSIW